MLALDDPELFGDVPLSLSITGNGTVDALYQGRNPLGHPVILAVAPEADISTQLARVMVSTQ